MAPVPPFWDICQWQNFPGDLNTWPNTSSKRFFLLAFLQPKKNVQKSMLLHWCCLLIHVVPHGFPCGILQREFHSVQSLWKISPHADSRRFLYGTPSFPVQSHAETHIGISNFHTIAMWLHTISNPLREDLKSMIKVSTGSILISHDFFWNLMLAYSSIRTTQ